jgi:hypothetical protein
VTLFPAPFGPINGGDPRTRDRRIEPVEHNPAARPEGEISDGYRENRRHP